MSTLVDHLVVGAATLEQGAEYIKRNLGIDMAAGGVHPSMGTHNLLLRLGKRQFLEVIAVHPELPAPSQPRWFGLDDPYVRRCLDSSPALLTWVASTRNIEALCHAAAISFGRPQRISRGKLNWLFGLPGDGRLLGSGLLPYLIEWPSGNHPVDALPQSGCELQQISLHHARPAWLESVLDSIQARQCVSLQAQAQNALPYLEATIGTPNGSKILRSITA